MSDRRVLTAAQDEGFSHLSIDLTVARVEELFKSGPFSGLIILNFGGIPNATIRFNSISAPPIPLLRGFQYDSQSGSFQRFFLTHDALPGETLDLILIRDPDVSIRLGGTAGLVNVGSGGLAYGVGSDDSDNVLGTALLDKQVVLSRLTAWDGGNWDRLRTIALGDGITASALAIGNYQFNGLDWDRVRGSLGGTALPSAVRNSNTNSPILINHNATSIIFFLSVTANPGGGEALSMTLRAIDPLIGFSAGLGNSVATDFGGVPGVQVLVCGLGGSTAPAGFGSAIISSVLPKEFLVQVVHSAGSNWTYSIGYSLT